MSVRMTATTTATATDIVPNAATVSARRSGTCHPATSEAR